MKVVRPTPLLQEAAVVLEAVRTEVVVVGATALQVAVSDAAGHAVSPTRDVDVVVATMGAQAIIERLECEHHMRRSEIPHERAFTWVRGDLKVQLVRTFDPHVKPPAKALPMNSAFGMARDPEHQTRVAFEVDPDQLRIVCANAACLVALKHAAFGRRRPGSQEPVARDYHDVYVLLDAVIDEISDQYSRSSFDVRSRVDRAIEKLAAGGEEAQLAARELLRAQGSGSQQAAERQVRRVALRAQRLLRC